MGAESDQAGEPPYGGGGPRPPPRFVRRRVVLAPGESRSHDEDEWRGVLVLVEAGTIELRCAAGGRRRFGEGSMLWFTGLDLRSVHNPGGVAAVLVAISRAR